MKLFKHQGLLIAFFLIASFHARSLYSATVFFKKHRDEQPLGNPEHEQQLITTGRCINCDLRGFNITDAINSYHRFSLWTSLALYGDLKPALVNLSGSDLTGAYCVGANFENGMFVGTKFVQADLSQVNGQGAKFIYAHFDEADLNHANLNNAYLISANLSESNLTDAQLIGARCRDATFNQALLYNTDLTNAQLQFTGFSQTDCRRANFTNANLSNATLEKTVLLQADLTNASLQNATIANVALALANLKNSNFKNAIITGTLFKTCRNIKMAHGIPRELQVKG